jgi:hypothetical protein
VVTEPFIDFYWMNFLRNLVVFPGSSHRQDKNRCFQAATDAARLFVQPNIQDLARARQSLEKIVSTYKIDMSNWQEELLKQIAFFVR